MLEILCEKEIYYSFFLINLMLESKLINSTQITITLKNQKTSKELMRVIPEQLKVKDDIVK